MKHGHSKNPDLHGNVPESSPVALLLIDVINHMDFDGSGALVRHAVPMARQIAALKQRARRAGIPVIYINDNFGRWQSDFRAVVEHCLNGGVPGEAIARIARSRLSAMRNRGGLSIEAQFERYDPAGAFSARCTTRSRL